MSFRSMKFRTWRAKGNRLKKVFIFGSPQTGKTTILGSLAIYLEESSNHKFRLNPVGNPDGVRLIRAIVESLKDGEFPAHTSPDFWENIHFEYETWRNGYVNKLIFQEIAGELVKRFAPTSALHDSIKKEQKDFLLKSNGSIIIASSAPSSKEEVYAVNDFLELLYRNSYGRPVLFILTKYDLIKSNYENEVQAAKCIYRNSIDLLASDGLATVISFSAGSSTSPPDSGISTENEVDMIVYDKSCTNEIPKLLKWLEKL